MIDSRDPYDLEPKTFAMFTQWKKLCNEVGIEVKLISGFRDKERQNQIYNTVDARGRRATNAKGGYSFHNYRCAWDFCIMHNGQIDWNDEKSYAKCGKIGESIGCFWGGHWTSLGDNGHLQSDAHSSIHESGLPDKYNDKERLKDFTKEDCDNMYKEIFCATQNDNPTEPVTIYPLNEVAPKPVMISVQPLPTIKPDEPSILGFLISLLSKFTRK